MAVTPQIGIAGAVAFVAALVAVPWIIDDFHSYPVPTDKHRPVLSEVVLAPIPASRVTEAVVSADLAKGPELNPFTLRSGKTQDFNVKDLPPPPPLDLPAPPALPLVER